MKILYFTDAHVEPDTDLSRFAALGKLIVDKKPDIIVQGGDFSSMLSLSGWDKDKRKVMEGRRYSKDVGATLAAISRILLPLDIYNDTRRRLKEKQYRPRWVWMEGNHEHWVSKYVDQHPEVEGVFDLEKEVCEALPDNCLYIPYKETGEANWFAVDGVVFTHAVRNRAGVISSKYLCDRALAEVFNCNVVFGHTHRLQTSTNMKFNAAGELQLVRAVNGGCFFEETPLYAAGNVNDYWKGVLLFEIDSLNNIFRIEEEIPLTILKDKYL
jgi:predicted phosphodiesterase